MENTYLVALSRQITLERQIDIIANNVANINTTGFKADKPVFEEYLKSSAHEDNFVGSDRRISFVQERGAYRDFSQGPVEQTRNPLDVAIDGNGFFAVQTAAGERYTQNGSFQINSQGQLVTTDGNPVLGSSGPIVFQSTDRDITIAKDGTVTVREGAATQVDSIRGTIKLVSFDNVQALQKEGANLFSVSAGATPQADIKSQLNQGFIEKSNVNSVAEMSRMIEAMRTYQNITGMMQQQGDLRKTAIASLADVPA
jgi:flagellar basal-body rod protein FlgF